MDDVALPDFAGSAWRGAFGRALRDLSCVRACVSPNQCPMPTMCAYRYLFETPRPPNAGKMRLYERVPHPFVIDPRGTEGAHSRGETISLVVVVVGRAAGWAGSVVRAFAHAGEKGIGSGRGRLRLIGVEHQDPPGGDVWLPADPLTPQTLATPAPAPPCPAAVRVRLLTPLRLKEDGHNVTPDQFQPHHLLRNVLRRISLLTYFHTDTPYETDFAALTAQARDVQPRAAELTWRDWKRYSSRQQTPLAMGGLIGTFVLDVSASDGWWPILWTGQWLHAGKGTSMGLGKYRLEPIASLP